MSAYVSVLVLKPTTFKDRHLYAFAEKECSLLHCGDIAKVSLAHVVETLESHWVQAIEGHNVLRKSLKDRRKMQTIIVLLVFILFAIALNAWIPSFFTAGIIAGSSFLGLCLLMTWWWTPSSIEESLRAAKLEAMAEFATDYGEGGIQKEGYTTRVVFRPTQCTMRGWMRSWTDPLYDDPLVALPPDVVISSSADPCVYVDSPCHREIEGSGAAARPSSAWTEPQLDSLEAHADPTSRGSTVNAAATEGAQPLSRSRPSNQRLSQVGIQPLHEEGGWREGPTVLRVGPAPHGSLVDGDPS